VLLECLQPLLTHQRRPQQSGFTRSRSTVDAILTLRLLAELHREFRKPLHVAYIDIKATFNSVDRQALWKALHATGAPQFLIQLIQDLHTGTMSGVRVGKRHSILPQVCGRDVYLPQHYSAWQLTGSCPDALAVLASHSMGQCLLTCTTQMMRYSLHRIKAGGRQNSSVL